MSRYIFDIETTGLLDKPDLSIHCIVTKDIDTNEVKYFLKDNYKEGIKLLEEAELIAGHNVIKYDIPALEIINGSFNPKGKVVDTIVLTRLIYSDLKNRDFATRDVDNKYIGSHSLAGWGQRLGILKDTEFDAGDWSTFSQEMLDYCIQDVHVNHELYNHLISKDYSPRAIELEHDACWVIAKQERKGFHFDVKKAQQLYSLLSARREELDVKLQEVFPPYEVKTPFTPKVNNKTRGYVKGVPTFKVKTVTFNASSRSQISDRLIKLYNWKPTEFSPNGEPKVDDAILSRLDFPEAKVLAERFMLEKRIAMLAEGKQAWLKKEVNNRIHGSCNTNATNTGRATHTSPNLGQIPAVGIQYGKECRELFNAPTGYKIVGCDMSGLEIRVLAHFVAKYDDGEYAKIVLDGDIHEENRKASGLETRGKAKSFFYCWLYGGGVQKIAQVTGKTVKEASQLKKNFLDKLPALAKLIRQVQGASERGYLIGLDRRKLTVRSPHSALNLLLQSAGALLSKQWLVEFDKLIKANNLSDVQQVVWVHDEIQVECLEKDAELVGQLAVESIALAGKAFDFRVPLDGEFKIGNNWSETH